MRAKHTMNYRWVVVFVMTIPTFLGQFHRSCTGVIRNDLLETIAMTGTQYGLLSSMFFYPYVVMQIPAGFFADRLGTRYSLTLGAILTAAGSFIFATANTFAGLCFARALIGIGAAFPVGCVQKANAAWFKDMQITTIGAWTSPIGYLGGVVAKAPLVLFVGMIGWRSTFAVVAAITLLSGVLLYFLVINSPAEAGVPQEEIDKAGITVPRKKEAFKTKEAIRIVFRNRLNVALFVVMPMVMGTYLMFTSTWGEPYLEEAFGMTNMEASMLTTYLMIGNIISNVIFPVISDKQKKRKPMLFFLLILGCVLWGSLVFGGSAIRPLLGVIVFLLGFTSAPVPLLMSLIREYNPRQILGISVGVCNTFGMSASAIFPVLCGFIMDKLLCNGLAGVELYQKAFIFPLASAVIALIGALFLKETNCKSIVES